jgi:hypothetical protein
MSENLLKTNTDGTNDTQPPLTDREQRRAWRDERRASRHENAPWLGGLILIALGTIFLLQNTGLFYLQNWWALFIMIPAIGSFGTAYAVYRNNGNRLNSAVRGSLLGGIVFTLISGAFLFGVNLGIFWPVLLILAGVGLLINFMLPN